MEFEVVREDLSQQVGSPTAPDCEGQVVKGNPGLGRNRKQRHVLPLYSLYNQLSSPAAPSHTPSNDLQSA